MCELTKPPSTNHYFAAFRKGFIVWLCTHINMTFTSERCCFNNFVTFLLQFWHFKKWPLPSGRWHGAWKNHSVFRDCALLQRWLAPLDSYTFFSQVSIMMYLLDNYESGHLYCCFVKMLRIRWALAHSKQFSFFCSFRSFQLLCVHVCGKDIVRRYFWFHV
jgi:hypothetical protein